MGDQPNISQILAALGKYKDDTQCVPVLTVLYSGSETEWYSKSITSSTSSASPRLSKSVPYPNTT